MMENSIKYENPENKVLEINSVAIYIYIINPFYWNKHLMV